MPCNSESEKRKMYIVSLLESRLGPLHKNDPRRLDWYSSRNGTVDVFITDSKGSFGQRPWFDMRDKDLKALATHPAGFVIFVVGEGDHYLVIPARELVAQLADHLKGLTSEGFYHFHTHLAGKQTFSELPAWDFSQYRCNLELIPTDLAILALQQHGN